MSKAPLRGRAGWVLAALLSLAAAQHFWNAWSVPPLTGYDAPGHAGYILSIRSEGQLPDPHAGWSTFHPPLYYLLGAGVWQVANPLGPRAVIFGIRALGVLAGLVAGAAAFLVLRRLGYDLWITATAVLLCLFVPASQFSHVMVGNEALAAGFVAAALVFVLRLQQTPGDAVAGGLAGLLVGLALATKYTSALAIAACAVPFAAAWLRERRLASDVVRAGLVCFVLMAVVAGPVYVRNLALTGSLTPMTRDREPMRTMEASLVLRPRRVADFVSVSPACLIRPSLYYKAGEAGSFANRNPLMTNVWCLTYAGAWYDPFGHRTSVRDHGGHWLGPGLAFAGLVPTAAMLWGFGAALAAALRKRGQTPDAPLAVLALTGLLVYIGIAATAPSAAAVKASYLLGLVVPAAVFFARAVGALPTRIRVAVLVLSAAAALLAALAFTNGLLYPPQPMGLRVWRRLALQLPDSHIMEVLERLVVDWYSAARS